MVSLRPRLQPVVFADPAIRGRTVESYALADVVVYRAEIPDTVVIEIGTGTAGDKNPERIYPREFVEWAPARTQRVLAIQNEYDAFRPAWACVFSVPVNQIVFHTIFSSQNIMLCIARPSPQYGSAAAVHCSIISRNVPYTQVSIRSVDAIDLMVIVAVAMALNSGTVPT